MERKAAGLIVFRRIKNQIEYLLLQSATEESNWTPPKGHIDSGETESQTALRETQEEAGFNKEDLIIIEDFKKSLQYTVDGDQKTVTYWLAELHTNTPVTLSAEHQDYKWLNLKAAQKLAGYKDFQNLLKECEDFLKKHFKKK